MNKKIIFFGLSGVFAVLTILATVTTVTSSIEMSGLNKKQSMLISERKDLEESLVKTNSSRELGQKSTELGFEEISEVFYLTKVDSVAQLP